MVSAIRASICSSVSSGVCVSIQSRTLDSLSLLEGLGYLSLESVVVTATELIVLSTALGCDSETCRYRNVESTHLSKVCTLTAEKLTHSAITLSGLAAEAVHSFLCRFHKTVSI